MAAYNVALKMRAIIADSPIIITNLPKMVMKTQQGRPYYHPDIKSSLPRPAHTYRGARRNAHFKRQPSKVSA